MGTPSHSIGQLTFLPPMADALLYQHDILATAKVDHAQPGVSFYQPLLFNGAGLRRRMWESSQ